MPLVNDSPKVPLPPGPWLEVELSGVGFAVGVARSPESLGVDEVTVASPPDVLKTSVELATPEYGGV